MWFDNTFKGTYVSIYLPFAIGKPLNKQVFLQTGKTQMKCSMQIQTVGNTEGYSESTEPIDAVNILPLARFEPTTSATPPSTTPDADATNCASETSPKNDVQEALILTTTDIYIFICFIYIKQ